jgi:NTP pyrophosphatase (non-canonical NTP hydrolase)
METQNKALADFQAECKRTRNSTLTLEQYFVNGAMGLVGEATETLEVIFRHQGKLTDGVNRDLLVKELGDIMWYTSDLATTLDLDLASIPHMDVQHAAEPWRHMEKSALDFAIHVVIFAGKIDELVKKRVFHGKGISSDEVKRSLARVIFYSTLIAATIDANLSYVLDTNVDKLRARYPEGFKSA